MRSALVTGGAGDIGKAVCEALAKSGYSIAVAYNSSQSQALQLVKRLQSDYEINCIAVQADLSEPSGADKLIKALDGFPKIDTLVNNAALSLIKQVQDITDGEIERITNVNFVAPLKLIRALCPSMIERGFGRIINISSMWGLVGASGESLYSATKAGIIGLTKALAKELGESGITVNCIAPGFIDTKMNAALPEEVRRRMIEETPLKRMGRAEDIASAVLFLAASDSFVNGEVLNISGGLVI